MICFSEPQLEPDEKYWECEPVTKIDMSFNSIKSIPPGIELMKAELVTLIIRSNEINELPMEIFELQKLRILDLSSNKLSNINENIMKLNELREIHVNDNLLTSIPISVLQCKSLVVLNAANNRITCIPTGLFNNQDRNSLNENKLKSINLSNNLITTFTTSTNSNLNSNVNFDRPEVRDNGDSTLLPKSVPRPSGVDHPRLWPIGDGLPRDSVVHTRPSSRPDLH